MQYKGKLYGKVGRKHVPLEMTADDVERLEAQRDELLEALTLLTRATGRHNLYEPCNCISCARDNANEVIGRIDRATEQADGGQSDTGQDRTHLSTSADDTVPSAFTCPACGSYNVARREARNRNWTYCRDCGVSSTDDCVRADDSLVVCDHADAQGCDPECDARVPHKRDGRCSGHGCNDVDVYVQCVPAPPPETGAGILSHYSMDLDPEFYDPPPAEPTGKAALPDADWEPCKAREAEQYREAHVRVGSQDWSPWSEWRDMPVTHKFAGHCLRFEYRRRIAAQPTDQPAESTDWRECMGLVVNALQAIICEVAIIVPVDQAHGFKVATEPINQLRAKLAARAGGEGVE